METLVPEGGSSWTSKQPVVRVSPAVGDAIARTPHSHFERESSTLGVVIIMNKMNSTLWDVDSACPVDVLDWLSLPWEYGTDTTGWVPLSLVLPKCPFEHSDFLT